MGLEGLTRTINPLAVLYFAQGTLYLAYLLWRCVFSGISFFRVPPALVLLYGVYLLLVFVVVLYSLYASYGLFSGKRQVRKFDLFISCFSAVLWVLPAILSFGNAATYLTDPSIPPDLKAQWTRHLLIGVFFTAIGVMNTASILYILRSQFRKPSDVPASPSRFRRLVSSYTGCRLGRSPRFPGKVYARLVGA